LRLQNARPLSDLCIRLQAGTVQSDRTWGPAPTSWKRARQPASQLRWAGSVLQCRQRTRSEHLCLVQRLCLQQ